MAQKILAVRLDNLGDVLMTTPALRALKTAYPTAKITLLTSSAGAGITKYIAEIDRVLVFDVPWVRLSGEPNSVLEQVERLKAECFDLAVIFTVFSQNPLPAALMCYLAGIPRRVGYCRENPYALLTDWVPDDEPYGGEIAHEVERQLRLVAAIGATTDDTRLSLTVAPPDQAAALAKLRAAGIDPARRWLVLHPGVSEIKRQYPVEGYTAAAALLRTQGWQIALTGVESERGLIEAIAAGSGGVSLAGALSLGELIGLIDAAPLLIANNTGPVHIAAAVGTPVVVLYAHTNPQHTPVGVPHRVLHFDMPAALRSRNTLLTYTYAQTVTQPVRDAQPGDIVQAVRELEALIDEPIPNVHKIAVLRATALGDYLAATPALHALRETYPNAEITYLGRPWHKSFLESRPSPVDRVIVVPVSHGVRIEHDQPEPDPDELDAFFAEMQEEAFDLAIQMHGGGANSNPFTLRLGAKFNVGMCTPDAPRMDRWMPYTFYQNEVMRLVELMRLVGAEVCRPEPMLTVTADDYRELTGKLPMLTSPFAVLHPGASDPRRRWSSERFAQVGDALAKRGLNIVVTGVGYEREVVERVIDLMTCSAVNACDLLSIGGLAALLQTSAVVVSNDTGPMHLANAVGAPNVAIFWCGNFLNWSHFNRSRHRPLPSWTTFCPLCGTDMMVLNPPTDKCQHEACFVDGVSVDDVITSAYELLDDQPVPGG